MYTLEESILKSKQCISLLMENRFLDAIEQSAKHIEDSLYHSHCHSLLSWIKAYVTLEMPAIQTAQSASEQTVHFCESYRQITLRNNFFVKFFLKANYEQMTDEEIHSELIRCEQLLFSTMMEFFTDQSLLVLVKVSYRMRSCYLVYKSLWKVFDTRQWSSDVSYNDFVVGVKIGLGVYNLLFSLLPDKVMNLLAVIGYKGSKHEGIKMLQEAAFAVDTFRSFGSQMILASYEYYVDQVFNVQTTTCCSMEKCIIDVLNENPKCIWYLFFKGRICLTLQDVDGALKVFLESLDSNIDIKQMSNLFLWEITWCHALMGNWLIAYEFCDKLRENCIWSLPTFYYMQASFLCMEYETRSFAVKDFAQTNEGINMHEKIQHLLMQVPKSVKRYAGKRIPIEKFACEKVEQYEKEDRLLSPAYELFLIFNMFIFIEGKQQLLEPILAHIEQCKEQYQFEYMSESFTLLCLLKAVCLRFLCRFNEAEKELFHIVGHLDQIANYKHLGPFTTLELAICKMNQQHYGEARQWLIRTKNNNANYHLELAVFFRIHKAFQALRKLQRQS